MQKTSAIHGKLATMVFAVALTGHLVGSALGYTIWQSLPPSEAQVASQEVAIRIREARIRHAQDNARYYQVMSEWFAQNR
jgi:hypothetical protein